MCRAPNRLNSDWRHLCHELQPLYMCQQPPWQLFNSRCSPQRSRYAKLHYPPYRANAMSSGVSCRGRCLLTYRVEAPNSRRFLKMNINAILLHPQEAADIIRLQERRRQLEIQHGPHTIIEPKSTPSHAHPQPQKQDQHKGNPDFILALAWVWGSIGLHDTTPPLPSLPDPKLWNP